MKSLLWSGLLILAGLTLIPGPGRPMDRQEPPPQDPAQERLTHGQRTYRIHCASCHGPSGRGDGPVARDLKVAPTDLTRLAARNEGRFPEDQTYMAIDGRLRVRGHGTAEMPVWGMTFQTSGSDRNQEPEVRERILDLLAYLKSVQR